jgi:hypothetical protein
MTTDDKRVQPMTVQDLLEALAGLPIPGHDHIAHVFVWDDDGNNLKPVTFIGHETGWVGPRGKEYKKHAPGRRQFHRVVIA